METSRIILVHLIDLYVFISPIAPDDGSWFYDERKCSKDFRGKDTSAEQTEFVFDGYYWGWFQKTEDFWWFTKGHDGIEATLPEGYIWIFFKKE